MFSTIMVYTIIWFLLNYEFSFKNKRKSSELHVSKKMFSVSKSSESISFIIYTLTDC